jgi:AcrR family transcriptional regulator
VTTNAADAPTPSAMRIVLAAERLFALHGIDGVSLRQIATEAGSANNSAVHYHFGSKDGLIAAIFRHRLPQLINERRLLTAHCDADDLRSRFEAHYLPVLHLADAPDSHYISFVEQLQRREMATRTSATLLPELPAEGQRSHEVFHEDLERLLDDLDEPLRQLRIAEAEVLCLHAAADREQAVAADGAVTPFELFASSLVDGLVGFLTAPASATTRRWLGRTGDVDDRRLRLL